MQAYVENTEQRSAKSIIRDGVHKGIVDYRGFGQQLKDLRLPGGNNVTSGEYCGETDEAIWRPTQYKSDRGHGCHARYL